MTAAVRRPPPEQVHDPSQLARGEHWSYTCSICQLVTQGGRGGLNAHRQVVHGIGPAR